MNYLQCASQGSPKAKQYTFDSVERSAASRGSRNLLQAAVFEQQLLWRFPALCNNLRLIKNKYYSNTISYIYLGFGTQKKKKTR